jgi:hypothetical protein
MVWNSSIKRTPRRQSCRQRKPRLGWVSRKSNLRVSCLFTPWVFRTAFRCRVSVIGARLRRSSSSAASGAKGVFTFDTRRLQALAMRARLGLRLSSVLAGLALAWQVARKATCRLLSRCSPPLISAADVVKLPGETPQASCVRFLRTCIRSTAAIGGSEYPQAQSLVRYCCCHLCLLPYPFGDGC